jgi:hypothetical protein
MFVTTHQNFTDILLLPPAMYRFYQVIICLLKFDFFCFTGVTMQVSVALTENLGRPDEPFLALDHCVVRQLSRVWCDDCCHPYCPIPTRRCWLRRTARNQMADDCISDTHVGSRIILQVLLFASNDQMLTNLLQSVRISRNPLTKNP